MSFSPPTAALHSRRTLLQLGALAPFALRSFQGRVQTGADGGPRFVDPPGAPSEALARRIAELETALTAGQAKANEILADPANDALRPYSEFRALIERHAEVGRVVLVPRGEPGTPFLATVVVMDAGGNGYPDVRVYAYQTSAKGWYAAEAPHVGGNSGDTKHARLFAHGRTDEMGHLELLTVRPGAYPASDLPSHIHQHLVGREKATLVTEIRFNDCPRMTPAMREASAQSGYPVVPVETSSSGAARCMAEFLLPG
jgi:protocatechuate 3,4-dioxygenase beta subunit